MPHRKTMYLTLILLIINQDPKFISIIQNYLVVYKVSNTKIKILNLKQVIYKK